MDESLTVTMTGWLPAVDGVPVNCPEVPRARPACIGRELDLSGCTPTDAGKVWPG